jgi:serine/threonine protein kinase
MAAFQPESPTDLKPGAHFLHYQLLEQIGFGGQGFVWSAIDHKDQRIVAVKFTRADAPDQKMESDAQFKRQAGQLVSLSHPHILPLVDFGSEAQYRYVVSPFISGGSLQDRIFAKTLDLTQSLEYCAKVASVLDYLHGKGVIHRDLKPTNALLDSRGEIFVADFGLARNVLDTTQAMHTGHGTPPYSPPEQHSLRQLTKKSDIFSFGVMIYEMFTGQLPWGGTKSLGLQQLFSEDVIPDPALVNPKIPPGVWQVLRVMTSADPEARYESASLCMEKLFAAFRLIVPRQTSPFSPGYTPVEDAANLLENCLKNWSAGDGGACLSLTSFAFVDLETRKSGNLLPQRVASFMLQNALFLGYDDEYWWSAVLDPSDRLEISLGLIRQKNLAVGRRVARHLAADPGSQVVPAASTDQDTALFLELARNSGDDGTMADVLAILERSTPAAKTWRKTALGPVSDKLLTELALNRPPVGDRAARTIGRIRSTLAVRELEKSGAGRRNIALSIVQQEAGSLPGSIPRGVRLRIFVSWVIARLGESPARLLQAYGWIFLGVALTAGMQVFITYRLPDFMDTLRILSSLERGGIFGLLFGLGILASRVAVERFPESKKTLRVLGGVLLGTILLNAAVFVYDVLLNEIVPSGLLVTAGCLMVAIGFSLAGLARKAGIRMLIAAPFVVLAISLTWLIHLALLQAGIEMTPIFFYDISWSQAQILLTVLVISLPMAGLGILGRLDPKPAQK